MRERIRRLFINHFDTWDDICENEAARRHAMSILFYFAIALVAFFMSLINIRAKTYSLLWVTGTLFVTMMTFGLLLFFRYKVLHISTPIVMVGCWLMCAYFLYSGGAEGFSIIWVVFFPFLSYFIIPRKMAHIANICLLLFVMLCFWTPLHTHLAYAYSQTYRNRFPMVVAFMAGCGWLSETMRFQTAQRLNQITNTLTVQAMTDSLTGIGNRHAFRMEAERIFRNGNASFAIIDVDHFKKVNDTYGHDNGDRVLIQLANTLLLSIRPTDKLYRWGGEEFLVLFPDLDSELLPTVLERLRRTVEQRSFVLGDTVHTHITVSIGGTTCWQDCAISKCIKRADQCLYQAKETGRNKVVVLAGEPERCSGD